MASGKFSCGTQRMIPSGRHLARSDGQYQSAQDLVHLDRAWSEPYNSDSYYSISAVLKFETLDYRVARTKCSLRVVFKMTLSQWHLHFCMFNFLKFPVPFGISTRYESAPVPLAVKSYKMAASLSSRHYTGCKIMCHSSSLFLIAISPR